MLPLTALYKAILESLGAVIVDGMYVSYKKGDDLKPIFIDKLRLALPVPAVLKESPWDRVIAFHPLSEDVLLGQSPVIKKLREMVLMRLTAVGLDLMMQLMEIAADIDGHKKLSPKQKQFLRVVPEADAKTVKALEDVLAHVGFSSNQLVNIYLRKGGRLANKTFNRVATVSFPILEAFEDGDNHKGGYQILGVTMRKKDRESIIALFNYIFPNTEAQDSYSEGTPTMVAPYFYTLMKAYINVAIVLNNVVDLFKKHLSDAEDLKINLEWTEEIEDLAKYRGTLPATLPGNDGTRDERFYGAKSAKETSAALPQQNWKAEPEKKEDDVPWDTSKPAIEKIETPVAPIKPRNSADDGSDWALIVARNTTPSNSAPFAHLSGGPAPTAGYNRPSYPMQTQTGWNPPGQTQQYQPSTGGGGVFAHLNPGGGGASSGFGRSYNPGADSV